jgi:hypothetical protein
LESDIRSEKYQMRATRELILMAWKKDNDTRQDGVLGLGGANPPRDRVEGSQDPEVAGTAGLSTDVGADPDRTDGATGSMHRSKGATGIDMGAGGEGTDIKP